MPARLLKSHPKKRGRPKKAERTSTTGRKNVYIMDITTFVTIPENFKRWIYERYADGTIEKPSPNPELEDIFYRSLAQNEIVSTRKWMWFIQTGGGRLLHSDPEQALKTIGLFPDEIDIANKLSSYELQRWYEMYYVSMIQQYGRCSTQTYPCYDPDVVRQVVAKYGIIDPPCEPTVLLPLSGEQVEPSSILASKSLRLPAKKRGVRPGGKTAIDYEGIEKLRESLMKCKTPTVIAKELDTSPQTVYTAMKTNMFGGKHELKKTMGFHVETLKRLIPKGEVTWNQYVRTYAICETALMRALYKSDIDGYEGNFVHAYVISPTKESIEYELKKFKGNHQKVAAAFGVPESLMRTWIENKRIGLVELPKEVTKPAAAKTLRKGSELTYDEHLARLGIDPRYDPLASEREKWSREYQIG